MDIDELPGHCPKPDLFPKKVMVSVWWGVNGIIHYSFLKTGHSITAESRTSHSLSKIGTVKMLQIVKAPYC